MRLLKGNASGLSRLLGQTLGPESRGILLLGQCGIQSFPEQAESIPWSSPTSEPFPSQYQQRRWMAVPKKKVGFPLHALQLHFCNQWARTHPFSVAMHPYFSIVAAMQSPAGIPWATQLMTWKIVLLTLPAILLEGRCISHSKTCRKVGLTRGYMLAVCRCLTAKPIIVLILLQISPHRRGMRNAGKHLRRIEVASKCRCNCAASFKTLHVRTKMASVTRVNVHCLPP